MVCVIVWNIVYYDGCCDTCDSKNAKSPVMCAYACAREGVIVDFFTVRKTLFLMGGSSIVFFCIRMLFENNTSLLIKRHVVFLKTIRCFYQNDTLFYNNRPVICGKTTGRLMSIKLQLWVGSCRMNMN